MNELKIMSTKIVVAPVGAPRLVYGLSLLRFECGLDMNAVYSALSRGASVSIGAYRICPFEKEEPSLILAEHPLHISHDPESDTCILTFFSNGF